MPREAIHFLVARRALKSFPEFHSTTELFLLGAVAHDAPYYHESGTSQFQQVAAELHGTDGEDTLSPLVSLLAGRPMDLNLRSFVAGMATHAATDMVFHPLVYYQTGDYFDPDPLRRAAAQSKHRRFETQLDLGARLLDSSPVPHISDLLRNQRTAMEGIFNVLPLLSTSPLSTAKNWEQALQEYARADRLFRSRIFAAGLSVAQAFLPPRLTQALDLTLPGKYPILPRVPLEFRNPVTGEYRKSSLAELCDEAEKRCLVTLTRVLDREQSMDGCSLNYGVFGATRSDARFFLDSAEDSVSSEARESAA